MELSLSIKKKLKLNHEIFSICDVNIAFFEEIFKYLLPSYGRLWLKLISEESSSRNLSERFEIIIGWLSNFLNVSIDHIDVHSLVSHDPLSLYNLLEILCMCFDENEDVPECGAVGYVLIHRPYFTFLGIL